jgi:hypothetical protein
VDTIFFFVASLKYPYWQFCLFVNLVRESSNADAARILACRRVIPEIGIVTTARGTKKIRHKDGIRVGRRIGVGHY